MIELLSRRPVLRPIPASFGGIVAPVGGDYSTIQDADDVLDAAPYSLYVKTGTYPGFTISTNDVFIMFGPGVVITGPIIRPGNNITIHAGPGCTLEDLMTVSGNAGHTIAENGLRSAGMLSTGNFGYLNGGGWDSVVDGGITRHAIRLEGTDLVIENIAAQTTGGGGSAFEAVSVAGGADRPALYKIKVVDSDDNGILIGGTREDALVLGCIVLAADADGISLGGPRARVEGNYVAPGVGGVGIHALLNADNSVYQYNIVDPAGSAITLDIGADNSLVAHNRTDGAITDNSAGSSVTNNNTVAF